MADPYFLDTNILLYSLSPEPEEAGKQAIAARLIERGDAALSTQVLHEFLHQATRKDRLAMTQAQAAAFVAGWRRFPIQESTLAVLDGALSVQARTNYSIWDCLIIAAAQALGCHTLYTEDMQDGRIIDGLRIINPFREGAFVP